MSEANNKESMTSQKDSIPAEVAALAKKPICNETKNLAIHQLEIATSLLLQPYNDGTADRQGMDRAFYAHFLMRMRQEWTNEIPTAGVSITDKCNLYINPHFFTGLSCAQQQELLVHEIEHIVYLHPMRGKDVCKDANDFKLMNIAMDANINVPLKRLTKDLGVTIERLNQQMAAEGSKYRIDEKDPAEVHYEKLKTFQQELGKKGKGVPGMGEGEIDDHSTWDESIENEEMAKAVVKDQANKAAEAAGAGSTPAHIQRQIMELNKSLVNWKRELSQVFLHALKHLRERSRAKRNRRTGIIFAGSKKQPKLRIGVLGDESGSMSDTAVAQIFAEIDKIHKSGAEVFYIAMDAEASKPIEYKRGMKMERTRAGGTIYSPGLKLAEQEKYDMLVVIGDGDCADKPYKPKNVPVIWVIVGDQKAPGDFGKHIKVPNM